MKIAVVGTGGVGGYFGARLAAAGNEVIFGARGAHRRAMADRGLKLLSALGDLHVKTPRLLDDPREVGFCEAVLLCVKLWDLEAAAAAAKPLVGPRTAVVPFQNGVESEDMAASVLGSRAILGGVAHIAAAIAEPGVIRHTGSFARLAFGARGGGAARGHALLAACEAARIEATAADDIERRIWEKFVLLSPLAGATCFHRCSIGEVLADPERRARAETLIEETVAVGRAKGIALADDVTARTLALAAGMPYEMKTSMLHDLEAGRRLELPWLNGAVVRLGRELGVATPENAGVADALDPYREGAAAGAG